MADTQTNTWEMIATERRRLADELDQLTPEQWATQTQCEAWDVRDAAAHIISPFGMGFTTFLGAMIGSGFNLNKMSIKRTAEVAEGMTNEQIVQTLRAEAENQWSPPVPGIGAEIPLSEIVVHGQDIRRPLGLECTVPQETIDFCLSSIKNDKAREDFRTGSAETDPKRGAGVDIKST